MKGVHALQERLAGQWRCRHRWRVCQPEGALRGADTKNDLLVPILYHSLELTSINPGLDKQRISLCESERAASSASSDVVHRHREE